MPSVRVGYQNKSWHYETQNLVLDANGINNTTAVTYDTPYLDTPDVLLPHLIGYPAPTKWTIKTASKTGFTFDIDLGVGFASKTIQVIWIAHEQV